MNVSIFISRFLRLFVISFLISGNCLKADYIPDGSLQPVWQSEIPEPASGPDWTDSDLDGLPAWYESWLGTDPALYDTDYDGINDGDEVSTTGTNPLNWDTDGNGQSDLADFYAAHPPEENPGSTEQEAAAATEESPPPDSDGDGLSDDYETHTSGSDPFVADSDSNGRSDYDDHYYPVTSPDSDADGLTDDVEASYGTNPYSVDTDGDGLTDNEEINIYFTAPNNAYSLSSHYTDWHLVDTSDSDGGGIPDRIETYLGMNPYDGYDDSNGDLDGDGVSNLDAYNAGISLDANIPGTYDRDGDGMTDVWEVSNSLNPDDPSDAANDPDADSSLNLSEFQNGTNPNVSDSSQSSTESSSGSGASNVEPGSNNNSSEEAWDQATEELRERYKGYANIPWEEIHNLRDDYPEHYENDIDDTKAFEQLSNIIRFVWEQLYDVFL